MKRPNMQHAAFLVMVNVPEEEWSYKIDIQQKVLGRSEDALIQIPLSHARVSRRHATVWRNDSEIWLRDEGSKLGTQVNGVFLKPRQPVRIAIGDRIGLADVELTVVGQLSKLAEVIAETGIRGSSSGRSGKGTKTASIQVRRIDLARVVLEQLTLAELDILLWMYRGYTSDVELSRVTFRSPHTVRTQIASIHKKLGVHSRADVVTWLKRNATLSAGKKQSSAPDTNGPSPPSSRKKKD